MSQGDAFTISSPTTTSLSIPIPALAALLTLVKGNKCIESPFEAGRQQQRSARYGALFPRPSVQDIGPLRWQRTVQE